MGNNTHPLDRPRCHDGAMTEPDQAIIARMSSDFAAMTAYLARASADLRHLELVVAQRQAQPLPPPPPWAPAARRGAAPGAPPPAAGAVVTRRAATAAGPAGGGRAFGGLGRQGPRNRG